MPYVQSRIAAQEAEEKRRVGFLDRRLRAQQLQKEMVAQQQAAVLAQAKKDMDDLDDYEDDLGYMVNLKRQGPEAEAAHLAKWNAAALARGIPPRSALRPTIQAGILKRVNERKKEAMDVGKLLNGDEEQIEGVIRRWYEQDEADFTDSFHDFWRKYSDYQAVASVAPSSGETPTEGATPKPGVPAAGAASAADVGNTWNIYKSGLVPYFGKKEKISQEQARLTFTQLYLPMLKQLQLNPQADREGVRLVMEGAKGTLTDGGLAKSPEEAAALIQALVRPVNALEATVARWDMDPATKAMARKKDGGLKTQPADFTDPKNQRIAEYLQMSGEPDMSWADADKAVTAQMAQAAAGQRAQDRVEQGWERIAQAAVRLARVGHGGGGGGGGSRGGGATPSKPPTEASLRVVRNRVQNYFGLFSEQQYKEGRFSKWSMPEKYGGMTFAQKTQKRESVERDFYQLYLAGEVPSVPLTGLPLTKEWAALPIDVQRKYFRIELGDILK